MKKSFKLVTSSMLIAAMLSACTNTAGTDSAESSKGSVESQASQAAEAGSATEINFMIPDWGVPSDALLAEFEQESGIKVNVNVVSWDDIRDKISIAAVGGEAVADVVEVDWSWAGEFYAADWLEEIKLTEEEIKDIPSIQPFIKDDKVLAVPYANDYRIAYYNKRMFDEAGLSEPQTWDDVLNAARKLKEQGIAEYPFTMPLNADESASTSLTWMALTRNSKVYDDNGLMNEASVVDAMEFVKTFVDEGLIDPANQSASGMDAYRKLTAGEAAFMVGPTSFVSRVNDSESSKVVDEVMPILIPGKTAKSEVTFALPEAVGVLKLSKNKEAAMKFVAWYTSAKTQEKFYKEMSTIPTRNAVLKKLIDEGAVKNPGAMLEQAKLIVSPYPDGIPVYYSEMSNAIFNSFNSFITGNKTSKEAIDEINAKITELTQ